MLAKPPLRGRAKSRLAAELGLGAAARLARAMLLDSWAGLPTELPGARRLLARCDASERYPQLTPEPDAVLDQGHGDLGQRMARLLADALAEQPRAVLLGTDAPGRPPEHLRAVHALLEDHDLVLGACEDGGFWCLASRASAAALHTPTWLDALDWERDDTATQVRARAAQLGLSLGEAPAWFDLDHARDLKTFPERAARERAPRLHALLRDDPCTDPLSIVLPTLDEGALLDTALAALAEQPGPLEIVVADGGSRDGSLQRAIESREHVVVRAAPGRGRQLAAGCALSTGEQLLVLHVDTRLPPGATQQVRDTLHAGISGAGAFVIHTQADPDTPNFAGPLLRLGDLRSRFTRHPYGDQAMFFTRAHYDAVGGFRPLPIMEDYDLSRRLAARTHLARLRPAVRVSGRRIQRHPLRSLLLMRLLPPLFRMGVDPERLARVYRRG
ncbi:MAG: hypothetical protein DHS20C15_11580 [Planctomycetota bacterium]|nr:MAG: hypothetical protein DHS20C15_11580 [Planctomycetota bacterium]